MQVFAEGVMLKGIPPKVHASLQILAVTAYLPPLAYAGCSASVTAVNVSDALRVGHKSHWGTRQRFSKH